MTDRIVNTHVVMKDGTLLPMSFSFLRPCNNRVYLHTLLLQVHNKLKVPWTRNFHDIGGHIDAHCDVDVEATLLLARAQGVITDANVVII